MYVTRIIGWPTVITWILHFGLGFGLSFFSEIFLKHRSGLFVGSGVILLKEIYDLFSEGGTFDLMDIFFGFFGALTAAYYLEMQRLEVKE